jgi:hypothetical protein
MREWGLERSEAGPTPDAVYAGGSKRDGASWRRHCGGAAHAQSVPGMDEDGIVSQTRILGAIPSTQISGGMILAADQVTGGQT